MSDILFNVAQIKLATRVEGPFLRTCIWFQGCDLGCRGCANPDFQPLTVRHILPLEKILELTAEASDRYGIEGVTLSGGEPMLQQGLYSLCSGLKRQDLGIILFTGKDESMISDELAGVVDLALCGPYIEKMHDNKRFLLGSSNKKIVPFSDRYTGCLDYFTVKDNDLIGEFCQNDCHELIFNGD